MSQIRDKLVQVMDRSHETFELFKGFWVLQTYYSICFLLHRGYAVFVNPSHSTSLHPNLHLSTKMTMFLASNLSTSFVSLSMCCSLVPREIIKISTKKINVSFSLLRVKSMAFWNSAGISVTP